MNTSFHRSTALASQMQAGVCAKDARASLRTSVNADLRIGAFGPKERSV